MATDENAADLPADAQRSGRGGGGVVGRLCAAARPEGPVGDLRNATVSAS